MTNLRTIGYEFRRIVLSRTYCYSLILLAVFAHLNLTKLLSSGTFGTAPYSRLSYVSFLTSISPFVLLILGLMCTSVFGEKDRAVRGIIFSSPITAGAYLRIRVAAILAACSLAALLPILYSFTMWAWYFRFFDFGQFLHPIAVFLLPPVVFVLGLSMLVGRANVKLLYVMIAGVFLIGALTFSTPCWLDLCGNNLLANYRRILALSFGTLEAQYHVPLDFAISRVVMGLAGVGMFVFASRRLGR